jgi:hypothetical protein
MVAAPQTGEGHVTLEVERLDRLYLHRAGLIAQASSSIQRMQKALM